MLNYCMFVCVKLLYVKFVCVKLLLCKEAGGGGEGARDTESKTRTPHKDVGNKTTDITHCKIAILEKKQPFFALVRI